MPADSDMVHNHDYDPSCREHIRPTGRPVGDCMAPFTVDGLRMVWCDRCRYWSRPDTSCPYAPSEPSRSDLESTQSEGVGESPTDELEGSQISDPVNSPSHYKQYPIEVIEITERLNFPLGNVVKYVLRADYKGKPLEDLKKAEWYLRREIANRERHAD